MDNTHGAFDGIVLKACPTPSPHNSSYIEPPSLTKARPLENMQLSHAGLFDRIKCEDMASDISGMFSRAAAAQLYERAQKSTDTLRYGAYAGAVDLRGVRSAAAPSCVPAYNVMDFIASSNSFSFLASASAEQMGPSTNNMSSMSTPMNVLDMHAHLSAEHEKKPFEKTMTTPTASRLFKKSRPQEAMEAAHHSQASKFRGQANLPTEFNPKSLQPHDQYLKSPSDRFSPDILDPPLDSSPISPNSPSKQDSALSGAEDGDTDWSKSQSPSNKRRKTQQKRVVCVPVGDAKQLKGESPPSDLWAWRKYGQKPIKGSPYPRGYYRCSSSKGCSARKQVERSCTDPTMLIVTYTSEHNHAWPPNKATLAANPQSALKPIPDPRDKCEDQSEDTATTSSSGDVLNENLFSTIINSASAAGEPVVSSLDTLQEEESFCLKRDVDLCFLSRPSMTEEDGVFDDLGELPEMSSIFSEGYNFEDLYRYVY